MNTHKKIKETAYLRGFAVLCSFLIVITGCTNSDNPFSSGSTESSSISIDDLNINVKYAESYDETRITFSRHWPEGITAGLGKMKAPLNGEIMVDYERINELIAYDENGYISVLRQFLEGDEKMNMPQSAFEELKATMPARDTYNNPRVREVMSGGIMKSYDKNGQLLSEYSYDEDMYRVTQTELEAYEEWLNSSNSESSINNNIQRLQNQGINFDIVNDSYATYSVNTSEDFSENIRLEYTDNLKTGLPISMVAYKEDGRIESVQLNQYKRVTEIPILAKQVVYQYGNINGEWDITYRTVLTRENIEIVTNY